MDSKIVKIISDVLARLHYDHFLLVGIDKQCHNRFGMSWDDVRIAIIDSISKGFNLIPGLTVLPQHLIQGIAGCTNNWMTNQFLAVLYLSYMQPDWLVDLFMKGLAKLKPNDLPSTNMILSDGLSNTILGQILVVAPKIFPDKVDSALKSHGVKKQKGYDSDVKAVNIKGGKIAFVI